jgi:hypothetical protein
MLVLAATSETLAQSEPEPTFPALTGRVVDGAGLLSAAEINELDAKLKAIEDSSSDQVVVVTVSSLQGYSIEDYGLKLGTHWGVGSKELNNGVLLIVAPNERKVRIEVGRGLEATLTDALSKTIIDTSILPRFRTGDFAAGIKSGAEGIARALGGGAASPAVAVTPSVPLPVAAAESAPAKSAWDEVLNQYRRRTDLIPNLAETVKAYAPRENAILDELAEARASAIASQSRGDIFTDGSALAAFQVAQDQVSNALEKLFAAAKNYPDLTSNQGFSSLQSQLEGTENRIAIARRDYINAARQPAVPETAKLEQPAPDATPASAAPAPQPKLTEQAPAAQPEAVPSKQVSPFPADQSRRLALVVGNDAYENLPPLRKAVNDARAVGEALTKLGFDVTVLENASRRAINAKLVEFTGKVTPGDTALFFYAGHGVTMGGTNYLMAADTPAMSEGQEALIAAEGIPADGIVQQIQGRGAKVAMLVLDACRDNPFANAGGRGVGGTRGLTLMTVPEGVFVLYSAGIGETALDRLNEEDADPNSVFTRTFVKLLGERGLTVHDIAKRTQHDVYQLAKSVSHTQMPAYYDQILGELTLLPGQ